MPRRESKTLEFKEKLTPTFLKTVSAFANFGGGQIVFGVADDGTAVGLDDPQQTSLDIENSMNDNLHPVPPFTLAVDRARRLVTLAVEDGPDKPYLYKGKAWRRADTATVEASRLELNRLVLAGSNRNYEDLPAAGTKLTFAVLEEKLHAALGVGELSQDILRTLGLFADRKRFNRAAELLADRGEHPGLDMARFGTSIDQILDRETWECESVLTFYDKALALFRKYYQYEKIEKALRVSVELIPENAFREAIANALVHRAWDVPSPVRVAMYPDRVEIASPGGLPPGLSQDEFLHSQISVLRNPILANVFFRLGLIEKFGTGVRRINSLYAKLPVKPIFRAFAESVQVTLPVASASPALNSDECRVVAALSESRILTRGEIEAATGFNKAKLLRVLPRLLEIGRIEKSGAGRGTKYRLN